MSENRASKRQREVLNYIDGFIKDNGFGPSYREIMRALNYKSVSTVATHVDELIARGFLRKRENSARSLQVMSTDVESISPETLEYHLSWLRQEITRREASPELSKEVEILKTALALFNQLEE